MASEPAEVILIDSDDEDNTNGGNGFLGKVEGCYIKFQLDDSGQIKKDTSLDNNSCLEKIVINEPVNSNLNVDVGSQSSKKPRKSKKKSIIVKETLYYNGGEKNNTYSEDSSDSTEAIKDKDNTIYECEDCNKKFTKRNSLLKHEKIHGLATFECDRCNKCFSQFTSLQNHKQTHPPIECLECYEIFSSQKELKEHEETHLEIPIPKRRLSSSTSKPNSQTGKFLCKTCKWECKNFFRLRKHVLKSHKYLIFFCNFCNEVLQSKAENEKHKDFVCPKKTFKCRNCLKRFPYDTALKRHRLSCEKKSSEESSSQGEDSCTFEPEVEIIE